MAPKTRKRGTITLGDLLAEYAGRFEGETLHDRATRMVESLTPKEREILRARFPLTPGGPKLVEGKLVWEPPKKPSA